MKAFLKRQWPLLGICALVFLVCFYLLRSHGKVIREELVEKIVPEHGLRLKDFRFIQHTPDKRMTWTLQAKEMRSVEDENTFEFEDFRIKMTPINRPAMALSGKRGKYFRKSGMITLEGDIVGSSEEGYRILVQKLRFNEKKGVITTPEDAPVTLYGSFFSVFGKGLHVDVEKEVAKVLSNVKATMKKDVSR